MKKNVLINKIRNRRFARSTTGVKGGWGSVLSKFLFFYVRSGQFRYDKQKKGPIAGFSFLNRSALSSISIDYAAQQYPVFFESEISRANGATVKFIPGGCVLKNTRSAAIDLYQVNNFTVPRYSWIEFIDTMRVELDRYRFWSPALVANLYDKRMDFYLNLFKPRQGTDCSGQNKENLIDSDSAWLLVDHPLSIISKSAFLTSIFKNSKEDFGFFRRLFINDKLELIRVSSRVVFVINCVGPEFGRGEKYAVFGINHFNPYFKGYAEWSKKFFTKPVCAKLELQPALVDLREKLLSALYSVIRSDKYSMHIIMKKVMSKLVYVSCYFQAAFNTWSSEKNFFGDLSGYCSFTKGNLKFNEFDYRNLIVLPGLSGVFKKKLLGAVDDKIFSGLNVFRDAAILYVKGARRYYRSSRKFFAKLDSDVLACAKTISILIVSLLYRRFDASFSYSAKDGDYYLLLLMLFKRAFEAPLAGRVDVFNLILFCKAGRVYFSKVEAAFFEWLSFLAISPESLKAAFRAVFAQHKSALLADSSEAGYFWDLYTSSGSEGTFAAFKVGVTYNDFLGFLLDKYKAFSSKVKFSTELVFFCASRRLVLASAIFNRSYNLFREVVGFTWYRDALLVQENSLERGVSDKIKCLMPATTTVESPRSIFNAPRILFEKETAVSSLKISYEYSLKLSSLLKSLVEIMFANLVHCESLFALLEVQRRAVRGFYSSRAYPILDWSFMEERWALESVDKREKFKGWSLPVSSPKLGRRHNKKVWRNFEPILDLPSGFWTVVEYCALEADIVVTPENFFVLEKVAVLFNRLRANHARRLRQYLEAESIVVRALAAICDIRDVLSGVKTIEKVLEANIWINNKYLLNHAEFFEFIRNKWWKKNLDKGLNLLRDLRRERAAENTSKFSIESRRPIGGVFMMWALKKAPAFSGVKFNYPPQAGRKLKNMVSAMFSMFNKVNKRKK